MMEDWRILSPFIQLLNALGTNSTLVIVLQGFTFYKRESMALILIGRGKYDATASSRLA